MFIRPRRKCHPNDWAVDIRLGSLDAFCEQGKTTIASKFNETNKLEDVLL